MVRDTRALRLLYKDRSTTVDMPGWYCDASEESIHSREDMKVSDSALMVLKAEVENLATPDEVRRIRLSLGLSQADAGRLIGGGIRAFQKYESGEILTSRAMTNLLRTLVRHPEDLELIRADLRDGDPDRETTAA